MGMPLREYYTLSRAAESLHCKVEDLIHWASVGGINLYIPIEEGMGYVHFVDEDGQLSIDFMEGFIANDFFSTVSALFREDNKYYSDFFDKNPPLDNVVPCIFSGLWALPRSAYYMDSLYEFKPGIFDLWLSSSRKMFVLFEDSEVFSINPDALLIIKNDFKLILNNKEFDDLPNYFNGGVNKIEIRNETNIRSEAAQERHARNELLILSAAIRFKETNSDVFNEECIKKDGSYNFSAWARAVADRVHLFPNGQCPVKSVETITSYISKHFKF